MTLSTIMSRVSYRGPSGTGPYTVPFRFSDPLDLRLTRCAGTVEGAPLVYGRDFTVADGGTSGGSVTLLAPLGPDEVLTIRRAPDHSQPVSLGAGGDMHPGAVEDALDRLAMQIQSLADDLRRAPKLGESVAAGSSTLGRPASAGQVVAVNAALDGFTLSTLGSAANVVLPGEGRTVATLSAYLAHNAGFNVRDYGAAGDGTTDDRRAIAAADAAAAAAGGRSVVFPAGTYRVAASLTIQSHTAFDVGAKLKPASNAVAVTMNFVPQAGRYTVFDLSGTTAPTPVLFRYPDRVLAEWFGLTPNAPGGPTATNDEAMRAAIQSVGRVAQQSGPSVGAFPAGCEISVGWGVFYMSDTIHLNSAVRLRGSAGSTYIPATIFVFPLGVDGLFVHYHRDAGDPNYGWAGHVVVEDAVFQGVSRPARAGAGHGCRMQAPAHLIRCAFNSFEGDGINVDADVGEAPPNNANLFHLDHCRAIGNGRHGLYVNGGDANAGLVTMLDAEDNGGWGVYDSSFLGNTYVACHTSGNRGGAYRSDDPNARNVFVGCYSESGQPASSLAAPTLVLGGIHGAGISAAGINLLDSTVAAPVISTARLYTTRVPVTAVPAGGSISISVLALPPNGTGTMLVRSGALGDEGLYIVGNNGSVAATVVPVRATPRVRIAVSGTDIVITNATGSAATMSAAIQGMNPE